MTLLDFFNVQDAVPCEACSAEGFIRGVAVYSECEACNSVGYLKTNQQIIASKAEANLARSRLVQLLNMALAKAKHQVGTSRGLTEQLRSAVYPEDGVKRGSCGSVYQGD